MRRFFFHFAYIITVVVAFAGIAFFSIRGVVPVEAQATPQPSFTFTVRQEGSPTRMNNNRTVSVNFVEEMTYYPVYDQWGNTINDVLGEGVCSGCNGTNAKTVITGKNSASNQQPISETIRATSLHDYVYKNLTIPNGTGGTQTVRVIESMKGGIRTTINNSSAVPAIYTTKLARVNRGTTLVDGPSIVVPSPNGPLELCVDDDADNHASKIAYDRLPTADQKEAMRITCIARSKPIDDCDDNDADKWSAEHCAPPPPPPPVTKNTILEYLEKGPDCQGREQQCPTLYGTLFQSLGIPDADIISKFGPIISDSICVASTHACRAWVCRSEFTGSQQQQDSDGAWTQGPLCGGARKCTDAVHDVPVAHSGDGIALQIAPSIAWKRNGQSAISTFSTTVPAGSNRYQEMMISETSHQEAGPSPDAFYSIRCPAITDLDTIAGPAGNECRAVEKCSNGCQDLDGDGYPTNPNACAQQIKNGVARAVKDCDDNNPRVGDCSCSTNGTPKVSLWYRNAPGAKPVPHHAVVLSDLLKFRYTLIADVPDESACLPKSPILSYNGFQYEVPAVTLTPTLVYPSAIFGNIPVYSLPNITLYNEGGKLQPLFGDIQSHEDFYSDTVPLPAGEDKRIGTTRRRFTATLDVSTDQLATALLKYAVITPVNKALVEKFKLALQQSLTGSLDKSFLYTHLKDFLVGNFNLSATLRNRISEKPLKDLMKLQVRFAPDTNLFPIESGDWAYLPFQGEFTTIANARALDDLLPFLRDDGPFSRDNVIILVNAVFFQVLGSSPQERADNVAQTLLPPPVPPPPNLNKSAPARSKVFSRDHAKVYALPELLVKGCESGNCSLLATAIEDKLLFAMGKLPPTTIVVMASGVGSGVIKHHNGELTIYFVDAQKPDNNTLKAILEKDSLKN